MLKRLRRWRWFFIGLIVTLFYGVFWAIQSDFSDPDALGEAIAGGVGERLILKAREGLKPGAYRDLHVHVIAHARLKPKGLSKIDQFCGFALDRRSFVNEDRFSWLNPVLRLKTLALMSASKIDHVIDTDYEYAKRLLELVVHFNRIIPEGGHFYLLALDGVYNDQGQLDEKRTDLYVSNRYVYQLAECLNQKIEGSPFVPVISVNPKRSDAFEVLARYAKETPRARLLKWLPNSQGFDPANIAFKPFYQKAKEEGYALLAHSGLEHAIEGAHHHQSFGEPGHYDQALASGLPLIMAHCGGLGSEQGSSKSLTDVFLDMMQKPQYRGQFWGELSGLMLPMRVHAWPKLMQSKAVEGRLL
ncbi:hypothetical protein ACQZV8_09355, partial [Magnetococcales bacterium HHB-1]